MRWEEESFNTRRILADDEYVRARPEERDLKEPRNPDRRAVERAVGEFNSLARRRARRPDGRLVVELSSAELSAKPWLQWNAFVALVSSVPVEELHPTQRPAWRAYEYDAEVQSGGHARYFEIRAGVGLEEAVEALTVISAAGYAQILAAAVEGLRSGGSNEELFRASDDAFGVARPRLTDVLEAYLDTHRVWFVALR